MIGQCSKAWGDILVDRASKQGGFVAEQLALRAKQKHRNPVCVFPEGTTTNGKYLTHFHRGAFVPGVPVKPVHLSYPHTQFSPHFESADGKVHPFR